LRSKTRTLTLNKITNLNQIPDWNYDGSSTYQADTENSEVILKPVSFYKDPFRGHNNILVMCETYKWTDTSFTELKPCSSNFRYWAKKVFDDVKAEKPWFGIEQEYTIVKQNTEFETEVHGWPEQGFPGGQGPYYCSVGANSAFGRDLSDMHYKACLYAGIKISGTNAEVMPGQWEYQVGPCEGIEIGDHMWVSRFLLLRAAEELELAISFDVKLFPDWNGSGCHTNYSTETMRQGTGGMQYITDMMKKFSAKHKLHCKVYGEDNFKRLTGHHETSSMESFSFGVGNRAASFRIPSQVKAANGKGYIEDRRPGSCIDPYVVGAMVCDTSLIPDDKSYSGGLLK